jgi:hypothetical protein
MGHTITSLWEKLSYRSREYKRGYERLGKVVERGVKEY